MKKLILCSILGLVLALMMATVVAHAEDMPICEVRIKITGPTYNQSPKTDFTINTAGVKKAADGAWYNSTDHKWMTSSEKFEIDKDYRFVAYFDLESGYKWGDGEVSVYINGVETSMVAVSGQTYKSAGVVFACKPDVVGYLDVSLAKTPVGG